MKKTTLFSLAATLLLAFATSFNTYSQDYVEIGSGTNKNVFAPVSAHLTNSVTQQLYLASEIGSTPREISAVAFHHTPFNGTAAATSRDIKLYISTTDESLLTQENEWLGISNSELVFQGSLNLPDDEEWVKIDFNEHIFSYDGHSNLVVTVIDNTGQTASGGSHAFYHSVSSNDDTRIMIGTNTSSDNYDHSALYQIDGFSAIGCTDIRFYKKENVELLTTKKWYGFTGTSWSNNVRENSFIRFSMQYPGQTVEKAYLPDMFVCAADYADGKVYFVGNSNPNDYDHKTLFKAPFTESNTSLANYEMIAELPSEPSDMSYNPANHTMYYLGDDHIIRSINLQNGETTLIGQPSEILATLAINSNGEAYSIGKLDGNLYRVSLTDASLTLVGNTGRDAYYSRTMAFDRETGELFWFQQGSNSGDYGLYKVNTQNGSIQKIGNIGDGRRVSIGGLFGFGNINVAVQPAEAAIEASVYPNPTIGIVNVTAEGLQRIEAMDITGRTVATLKNSSNQTFKHSSIDLSAQPNGIYILRITTAEGTSMRKIMKR